MLKYLVVFIFSLVLSFGLSLIIRRLAQAWNIVDRPGEDRKIHTQATPLLGGWAPYLTSVAVIALLWLSGSVRDPKVDTGLLIGLALAGLVLTIGGYLDDRYRLPWYGSLGFPMSAAAIALVSGLQVQFITNPLGGIIRLDTLALVATTIAFLWLVAMMMTVKLLDGVDGLVGTIGTISALVIFAVSLRWDEPQSLTSYASLVLAGSLIGFLILNWHPAKLFLGESATFIGFALGVLAILTGGKIATAMLVMGLPMLDVIWVIIRRWHGHRSIVLADSGHLHHRLLALGLRQEQVVLSMAAISTLFGATAVIASSYGKVMALFFLIILMLWFGWFIAKKRNYEK